MGLDMWLDKKTDSGYEEIAEWRKAYTIHSWFCNETAPPDSDCDRWEVPLCKLKELNELCKALLAQRNIDFSKSYFQDKKCLYDDAFYKEFEDTVKFLDPLIIEFEEMEKKKQFFKIYYGCSY